MVRGRLLLLPKCVPGGAPIPSPFPRVGFPLRLLLGSRRRSRLSLCPGEQGKRARYEVRSYASFLPNKTKTKVVVTGRWRLGRETALSTAEMHRFLFLFLIPRTMLQEGAHGKWTVSSSDESTEENSDSEKPSTSSLLGAAQGKASGPQYPCSEARKAALKRKASPVKFSDKSLAPETPPAEKQRASQEGLGWCLSSSDEEPEDREKSFPKERLKEEKCDAPKEPPLNHSKDERLGNHKAEDYNEAPNKAQDTWDLLNGGNPFRFFLTKVTGIEQSYNSGALHIKGERVTFVEVGFLGVLVCTRTIPYSLWLFLNAQIPRCN